MQSKLYEGPGPEFFWKDKYKSSLIKIIYFEIVLDNVCRIYTG